MCLLCEELWMAFDPAPQPDRAKFIADAPPQSAEGDTKNRPVEQLADSRTASAKTAN